MHCTTAVVSPACTLYRPGPRRPSLNVSCHFLSLSSKLMYRSAWIAVSCSGRAIWVVDISILLGNGSLKPSFLAQSLPIEPAPHSISRVPSTGNECQQLVAIEPVGLLYKNAGIK